MARVLIVGCGCRGQQLAEALVAEGHAVRGTTRDPARCEAIAAAGAEPVVADPDRLGTLMPHLAGVSVLCWLMASATGEEGSVAALHGPRLEAIAEKLVDTHVRGVVYEAMGTVDPRLLAGGAAIVRRAADTWLMPVEVADADPADVAGWTEAMRTAVGRILGG
jgi:NAD(P)H-binding